MTNAAPAKSRSNFSVRSLFARPAKPYVHPYRGGILLGIVLFLAFLITRNGLGASGGLNRLVAGAEDAVVPGHIDRTPYLLKLAGGELNPLDDWSVPVLLGAFLGGAVSGLLFAYGARMARGCTSGQALSGGATLSAGSWAIMLCIFAGAYGLAYFARKLWN